MISPIDLQAYQDRSVAEQVALCYRAHPYYSLMMRRLGLTPDDIVSVNDLTKLPVTTKQDFLADPQMFLLDSAGLPTDQQTIWDVVYTTGTTSGAPAPVYSTTYDHLRYLQSSVERAHAIDLRRGDRLVNLFPLTRYPSGAHLRTLAEAGACGASVIAGLPGRTAEGGHSVARGLDDIVDLAVQHCATVLVGVAGFVRRFLVRAAELGATLGELRVCRISGEVSSNAFRADLEARMRSVGSLEPKVIDRYGSTEQGTSMVECEPGSGFHDLAPAEVFFEVASVETDERMPDGDPGRLVFTHLVRRGTVFLRYAVGDLGVIDRRRCESCGSTSPRLVGGPVRARDIVKVKGTLVNLDVLQAALDGMSHVDEYQIVIAKEDGDPLGMDMLTVLVAVDPHGGPHVPDLVARSVKALTHVTPRVQVVDRNVIFDPLAMAKPKRVLDARAEGGPFGG